MIHLKCSHMGKTHTPTPTVTRPQGLNKVAGSRIVGQGFDDDDGGGGGGGGDRC